MELNKKIKINCIIITLLILSLDQFTKYLITRNFSALNYKDFFLFSINLIKNDGAAFNLFSKSTSFLSFISITTSIIIILIILFSKRINYFERYSLSFILGGSLGNGIDRISNGFVVDFINLNFINFPIFNIADISINIGFLLLLYKLIKNKNSN
tara:strand:+ start:160 stop:624 length:465 start_codon:yes stop_codon:yes gene_type:complete